MPSPMDALMSGAHVTCPHCGKVLERTTVTVGGVTYNPPCYGSCGCAASRADMNPPKQTRTAPERCMAAGIPSRFAALSLDVTEHVDSARRGEWLYIHGDYGEGKSATAAQIAKALVEAKDRVEFASSVAIVDAALHEPARFERMRTVDYLVVDDIGKEADRDWSVRWMYELVNSRYANQKWTCFTSNYSLAQLAARMASAGETKTGEAIASRLQECRFVKTEGIDWRAE